MLRFAPKLPPMPPKLKALPSLCFRKASKSGFWSSGIMLGDAAAVERMAEDGGLKLVLLAYVGSSDRKESSLDWKPK